jgi:RNA polymerase sigma-B factor
MVRAIARRYAGRGETVDDLIQVGAIALIRASDRFDPDRGVPFATFATPAVEGEIRRHLADRTGSVHIPRQVRRITDELERSRARLATSLGRSPTLDELAEALGLEPRDIERALKAGQVREPAPAVSEDVTEAAGDPQSPQSIADDRLLLAGSAHVLDDRERRIVFLRFHADMTERDIAEEVGISQAQVSRLLARALAKLRKELDDENARSGGGDITGQRVVPAAERPADPPARSPTRRKSEPSEAGETRIAAVGALEEQAHPTRTAEAAPKPDLALPYHVTVKPEGGERRGGWTASLDELPGCEARGTTPDQAVENLRAAMENWLSAAIEDPHVISPPSRAASKKRASSHSGRFLVRMSGTLHEELTRAAEREQVSLNRYVTAQLAAAVASSSVSTAAGSLRPPGDVSAQAMPPPRKRSLRILLGVNLLVMVLAAAGAIALLVLALEQGI